MTFVKCTSTSTSSSRKKRSTSTVRPHDSIWGTDVPEEFNSGQLDKRYSTHSSPWTGVGKHGLGSETLDYRFGLLFNASCKVNEGQNQEIDALRIAVMQHRVALDMILAEKGGLCVFFNTMCCTYIPDNVHSLNMASDSKETVDRRWSFPGFILFYFAFLYLCYSLFKSCNFTDDTFITHSIRRCTTNRWRSWRLLFLFVRWRWSATNYVVTEERQVVTYWWLVHFIFLINRRECQREIVFI